MMKHIVFFTLFLSSLSFGFGIGPSLSYTDPEQLDGTFSVGARGEIFDFVGVDINHWESDYDGGNLEVSSFRIKPWVRYLFDSPVVKPYAGVGVGFNFLNIDTQTNAGRSEYEDEEMGFHVFGGTNITLNPLMHLFAEVDLEVISDYSTRSFTAGFIFGF